MNTNVYLLIAAISLAVSFLTWKAFRRADQFESTPEMTDDELRGVLALVADFDAGKTGAPRKEQGPTLEQALSIATPAGWTLRKAVPLRDALLRIGAGTAVVTKADRMVNYMLIDASGVPQMGVFIGPLKGDEGQVELAADAGLAVLRLESATLPTVEQLAEVIAQL